MLNITIEEIKDLLAKLGISTNEMEDGKLVFVDEENQELMKVSKTGNPLLLVPKDEVSGIASLEELLEPSKFICFQSPNKFLKYYLLSAAKPNGEKYLAIHEIAYQKRREDGCIEDSFVRFNKAIQKKGEMQLNSYVVSEDALTEPFDRKNITIYGDGTIQFELKDQYGFFTNGKYDEEWHLQKEEMGEELKTNELITNLTETFGKQFPHILETLKQAKEAYESFNK